jgi:hypothetical protein
MTKSPSRLIPPLSEFDQPAPHLNHPSKKNENLFSHQNPLQPPNYQPITPKQIAVKKC